MTVNELIKNGVNEMWQFDITDVLHEREQKLVEQGVIKQKFIINAILDIISDTIAYVTIDIKGGYCPYSDEVRALFDFEPEYWDVGPYSNECFCACLKRNEMLMLVDYLGINDIESIN